MIFKLNICSFLLRRKKEPKRARLAGGACGSIAGKFLEQYTKLMQRFFFAVASLAMVMVFSVSCGAPEIEETVLTGNISISEEYALQINGPVFVAVSKTDSFDEIENDPMNSIAVMTEADLSAGAYSIDLTDTGLKKGDRVFIFAFVDNDYNNSIPYPSTGDIVGFYVDSESLKTVYTLGGELSPDIILSRYHYGHKSEFIGVIDGNETGSVILIAYAGDFISTDFSSLDVNAVVGYKKITKPAGPYAYTMNIMPYGFDVPIEGVYLIALHDKNGNGIPDDGDMIGFPLDADGGTYPSPVIVLSGVTAQNTIRFTIPVYSDSYSSGNVIRLTGEFNAPEAYASSDKPVHIVVVKGTDPNTVFADMENVNLDSFEYLTLARGSSSFEINLPRRKFQAGDEIILIALWDSDYKGGLPAATAGDIIGFVQNPGNFSYTLTLRDNENVLQKSGDDLLFNGQSGYEFNLDRKMYAHDASISFRLEKGALTDDEFVNGKKVICFAVREWDLGAAGMNFQIDMKNILGVLNADLTKELGQNYSIKYSMPVMPAIHQEVSALSEPAFKIEKVWVLALLDANGNGKPDDGEMIGFSSDLSAGNYPASINVETGINTANNIKFKFRYYTEPDTGEPPLRIMGGFDAPEGYSDSDKPVYILAAKGNDPNTIYENLENLNTEQFDFVRVNQGSTEFELTLSRRKFKAGDEIILLAFWDKDAVGTLPQATEGDMIGFVQNGNSFSYTLILQENDNTLEKQAETWNFNSQTGYEFKINRKIYDHQASIRFRLDRGALGEEEFTNGTNVICFAVREWDLGATGLNFSIDMNKIIAAATVPLEAVAGTDYSVEYSMSVMPALLDGIANGSGSTFSIEDIWIISLLDTNGNGVPDDGEMIGITAASGLDYGFYPVSMTVKSGINIANDVDFKFRYYTEPDTGADALRIIGAFDAPAGYGGTDKPVYVVAVKGNDPNSVYESIKNFETEQFDFVRAAPGSTEFVLNLSRRKFAAGDEIILLAFWDVDASGTLPQATEGDMIGFVQNGNLFSYTLVLQENDNILQKQTDDWSFNGHTGYDFKINRKIYDHNASIKFRLEQGQLTDDEFEDGKKVLCFAVREWDIAANGLNLSVDMDNIIGVVNVNLLKETDQSYSIRYDMPVMPAIDESIPAGSDFSIEKIWVLALLDENGNGKPDDGEMIGLATDPSRGNYPASLTVESGVNVSGNVRFKFRYYSEPDTGEPPLRITGSFKAPEGYPDLDKPVYILAAKGNDPNRVYSSIKDLNVDEFDFMRVAPGSTSFELTLSRRKFKAGDQVVLLAFWDLDAEGVLPEATAGDKIGFVVNRSQFSYTLILEEDDNVLVNNGETWSFNGTEGYEFILNRKIYDNSSSIRFRLDKGELDDASFVNGKNALCLAIYNEEMISLDYEIDMDKIIAVDQVTIQKEPGLDYTVRYTMPLMPALHESIPVTYTADGLTIENVWVMALLDENGNGKPDNDEFVGFASDSNSNYLPVPMTIEPGINSVYNIRFKFPFYADPDDPEPPLRIFGGFDIPDGYFASGQPVHIIAARGSDPNAAFKNIKNLNTQEFDFITLEPGAETFEITLSRKKFKAGDEILLIAFWDLDNTGGFPDASEADMIGFVQKPSAFSYTLTLQEYDNYLTYTGGSWSFNGSSGYNFKIDRIYYEHSASIRLRLERGDLTDAAFADGKKVICLAVWDTGTVGTGYAIDMNDIIGTANVSIQREAGQVYTIRYSMPLMPALHENIPVRDQYGDFSIDNVWIIALLDENGNGKPDAGEKIGFYWKTYMLFWTAPDKLPVPLGDGVTYLDKNVRFSNQSY